MEAVERHGALRGSVLAAGGCCAVIRLRGPGSIRAAGDARNQATNPADDMRRLDPRTD